MRFSLFVLVLHENNQEALKDNDGIKINAETLINGIPLRLSLGSMNNFLNVIKSEGTEENETSIEPYIEESWAWPKHLHD